MQEQTAPWAHGHGRPLISASSPASTLRSRRFQADRLLFLDEMSVPSPVLSDREVVPEAGTGENDTDDVQPLPVLPKAVVVSGLEHASLPAQRALCLALAERRLIFEEEMASANSCLNEEGTWNLPDDFIMIYVCKADGHDRPALLGALLDKFAMSTDVVISPAVRHAYAAYRGTPSSTPLASPFATPHSLPTPSDVTSSGPLRSPPSRFFALPSMSTSKPISPPVPPAELALLRASSARTVMHPFLSAYLRNLFYAARQHPLLDGTLLTRRTHRDADALVRAFRVIAGDSVGADLLRAGFAGGLPGEASEHASTTSLSTREPAEWEKGVTGIDWARRGDGASDREAICGNGATDEPMPVNLPFRMPASEDEVDPDDKTSMLGDTNEVAVWDVSEVDVARVFPRIVSHHLRVRGGPDEEILGSINWPAVEHLPDGGPNPRLDGSVYERKTVKEVLVQILGDV
ncbi:predicted protein [Postia placenta Mad-698-R]|uniref:Uncharacterized protein n=1 Tax=Postia placenta MAD-698-R-SB12 TaxID=670580 RepID=A0A1X6NBR5_9APHY|nr:hypothetical protein POSPLADRAFT_1043545 [Postia placenta MAD-698-R-SB12]EED79246.1 predicted protein [Postia placenta Mad-698-R]OSX66024.1 hypothetical protein POSPLADRAFT_1043545 [Postia placenta MAD-698-R-SB12]